MIQWELDSLAWSGLLALACAAACGWAASADAQGLAAASSAPDVAPDMVMLHFVDAAGASVGGVKAGSYADWSDESWLELLEVKGRPFPLFARIGRAPELVSDFRGEVAVKGELLIEPHWPGGYAVPIYALHRERGLAGIADLTRDDFGRRMEIRLAPACSVTGRLSCPGLERVGGRLYKTYCRVHRDARQWIIDCNSVNQRFAFLLPPGRYLLAIEGQDACGLSQTDGQLNEPVHEFEVQPGQRELNLAYELAPSRLALLWGKAAPELHDVRGWLNGAPIRLTDLKGKVVLLHFTWDFGLKEWPSDRPLLLELAALQDRFAAKGLVVLAVYSDTGEPVARVEQKYEAAHKGVLLSRPLPFRVALDGGGRRQIQGSKRAANGATATDYGITRVATVIIDREGTLVSGFELQSRQDELRLLKMLEAPREATPGRDPPRFRLKVGQKLWFSEYEQFAYQSEPDNLPVGAAPAARSTNQWQLWVVEEGTNGWTLLATVQQKGVTKRPDREDRFEELGIARCQVSAEGLCSVLAASGEGSLFDFWRRGLFIPLPGTVEALERGWCSSAGELTVRGRREAAGAPGQDNRQWRMALELTDLLSGALQISHKANLVLDCERGLVRQADSVISQEYGHRTKTVRHLELIESGTFDPDTLQKVQSEFQAYFDARQTYEDLMRTARTAEGTGPFDEARQALKQAWQRLTVPELRMAIVRLITDHGPRVHELMARSSDRLSVDEAKPELEWQVSDLQGNTRRLSDYRGKVVVLDFWYRGCGPCIRAMPQLKELVEQFGNRPVVLLGMNTDSDPQNASYIASKMKLNYPTLLATNVVAQLEIEAFPTLVILDQRGAIRLRHVGYTAKLKETLAKEINALLRN